MGRKTSKGGRGRSMEPNVLLLANPSASQDVLYKILARTQDHLDHIHDMKDDFRKNYKTMKPLSKARVFQSAAESLGFIRGAFSTVTLTGIASGTESSEILLSLLTSQKEAESAVEELLMYFT